jgi:hypothetical protein
VMCGIIRHGWHARRRFGAAPLHLSMVLPSILSGLCG